MSPSLKTAIFCWAYILVWVIMLVVLALVLDLNPQTCNIRERSTGLVEVC